MTAPTPLASARVRSLIALMACLFAGTLARAELGIELTTPTRGALVHGIVRLEAAVSGNEAVKSVRFFVDGVNRHTDTTVPYEWDYDLSSSTGIRHDLEARAVRLSDGLVGAESEVVPVYRRVDAAEIAQRLAAARGWILQVYAESGDIHLLSALPSGFTYAGTPRPDLKSTHWLQNNALYAYRGLMPWESPMAHALGTSYLYWYAGAIDPVGYPPHGINLYPVGGQPPWDDVVADDKYRRAVSTTVPAATATQSFIVGTDTGGPAEGVITADSPRNLLKYGVLRQVMKGNRALAHSYFQQSLATWDGMGFVEPKTEEIHGYFYGRTLAFTLMGEKALGASIASVSGGAVSREDVEARLWALQNESGGMWVTYHPVDGIAIGSNKVTPETISLALLAYGPNLWDRAAAQPTEAPRDAVFTQRGGTTLALSWQPPVHRTDLTHHLVDLSRTPDFTDPVPPYDRYDAGTATSLMLTGLEPDTVYHARIWAFDEVTRAAYAGPSVSGSTAKPPVASISIPATATVP